MKSVFTILLSLLQFLAVTFNLVPINTEFAFGGTPYVAPAFTETLTLAEDGVSDYRIIIPQGADTMVRTAAEQLQSYFFQITGAKPVVAEDTSRVWHHEILLGDTNRRRVDVSALGTEGFTIFVEEEKLYIAGGRERGVLYGVFAFLEEQLGCRWWTPTVETVPESPTLKIDKHLHVTQTPSFAVRCNRPAGLTTNPIYYAKNRTNVTFYNTYPFMNGGYDYTIWDDTMREIVPDSYFEEDPEIFALDGETGERTLDRVCMTNEHAYEITLAYILRRVAERRASGSCARYVHIGQKDVTNQCDCQDCTAVYETYGAVSATTILFCNRLADDLEAAGFGDYIVTFYAYQETTAPPTKGALRCGDRVIPVICASHYACMVHPWTECGYQDIDGNDMPSYRLGDHSDTIVADWYRRWAEVADTTLVYDYTINFLNSQMFLPNLAVIQPNYKYLTELGITGFTYTCGDGHTAAFNELRNYILWHVMWDVDVDVERLVDEFLDGYYGAAAAPYIKEFICYYTAKTAQGSHATNTDWEYQEAFFSFGDIAYMDRLWKKALAADVTEEQLFRIETAELSWEFRKANAFMGQYMLINPGRAAAQEKLYDDFIAHGITAISSFSPMPPKEEINFFLNQPMGWR